MTREPEFDYEDEMIKAYAVEQIAVMKLKCHIFDAIIDLEESGKFLSLIRHADHNPRIKALLLLNEPGCFGDEAYDKFLKRVSETNESHKPGVHGKFDRMREINVLNQIITHLVEFKKISAVGFRGSIVTPFFGASLGADFRYGSEGAIFSLSHLKYGLHPTGALPFFLPFYVGHSKAVDILFKGENIDMNSAKDLGLINMIFSDLDFETQCIDELSKLCALDSKLIYATKLLVNFSRSELRNYFELESALIKF